MDLNSIKLQPVEVRQSAVNCYFACRREWLLKYRMGIVLRGETVKESANLGRIYHKLKEVGPERVDEVKAWVRQRQAELMERVGRGEDIDGSMVTLANLLTNLFHKALVMAQVFWSRYPQPKYLEDVAREIEVSFPNGTTGISIGGRLDRIVKFSENGKVVYWIWDDKSTGRELGTIFNGLEWSIQARLYRILAQHYLSQNSPTGIGPKVEGFIMDGIVRPGIKLCKKDEKNAKEWGVSVEEAYLRRVKEWYAEQESLGKDAMMSKAMRYNEPIWNKEIRGIITRFVDAHEMTKRGILPTVMEHEFPRDVSRQACYQYESLCEYHDLCKTCPANWDELFEFKYKFAETLDGKGKT